MFRNFGGQKLTVFAFDRTTNAPKTGDAANITAYVRKDNGATTQLTDTSASEDHATNSAGYYTFDLSQTETDADKLHFTAKSSTANIVVVAVPAVVFTTPHFQMRLDSILDSLPRNSPGTVGGLPVLASLPDPGGYWRYDNDMNDDSGNGHTQSGGSETFVATPILANVGLGTSSGSTVGNYLVGKLTGRWSVGFWFQFGEAGDGVIQVTLDGNLHTAFAIIANTAGDFSPEIVDGVASAVPVIDLETPHFFVLVMADGVAKFYLDNALFDTLEVNSALDFADDLYVLSVSIDQGTNVNTPNWIAELFMGNYALSPETISYLHNGGTGRVFTEDGVYVDSRLKAGIVHGGAETYLSLIGSSSGVSPLNIASSGTTAIRVTAGGNGSGILATGSGSGSGYRGVGGNSSGHGAVLIRGTGGDDLSLANSDAPTLVNAIWAFVVEGAITATGILRGLLAFIAGTATGGGSSPVVFKSQDGNKSRISLTVDANGNRSLTSLDLT